MNAPAPKTRRCTCTTDDRAIDTGHLRSDCPFYVEWRDRRPAACYRLECGHRQHDGRTNPNA